MNHRLRPARTDEAPELSRLARDAKAYWGYPEAWLAEWRNALTIAPGDLERHPTIVAETDEGTAGFVMLILDGEQAEIEHLWVAPSCMGRGVGGRLLQAALAGAREAGHRRVRVVSDPNARAFYERFGGKLVGEETSSPPGRRLPVLELEVATGESPTG